MSKPMGLTADFRIIRPTSAEDKIWEAVEAAMCAVPRMTVRQFISEAQNAWDQTLRDEAKEAAREFDKARG